MLMGMFPVVIMIAIVLVVFGMFFGSGSDFDGMGYGLRRYWWMLLLMLMPLFIFFGGGDWVILIFVLIAVLVGGALFLWWLENDFELPKGDPIKKGLKWLRENIRW
jgi:hypothetical protein